ESNFLLITPPIAPNNHETALVPRIHPPAVTFIRLKLKIESDYMKAMKFIDDNPDYFSTPITRKIQTSLKNIKKYLIDGPNGSISASPTKTIWTANIAPKEGTYLQYK
ncbi:hypothetical protein HK100_010117, partial [Physocladia obscura]